MEIKILHEDMPPVHVVAEDRRIASLPDSLVGWAGQKERKGAEEGRLRFAPNHPPTALTLRLQPRGSAKSLVLRGSGRRLQG